MQFSFEACIAIIWHECTRLLFALPRPADRRSLPRVASYRVIDRHNSSTLFRRPTPTALAAHVADFISARDGHAADPKDVFLTNGASAGVAALLSMRWVSVAAPRLCSE